MINVEGRQEWNCEGLPMHLRCFVLAASALTWVTATARADQYLAGVGRADITPRKPIWMAGYASRQRPSEGVDHPLQAKALALRDMQGHTTLLWLCADIIGFPREVSDRIAQRIGEELRVPRECIVFAASHTHTGPVIAGNLIGMFDLRGQELATVEEYTRYLEEQCFRAARQACSELVEVTLAYHRGEAGFAMNRRVFSAAGTQFGENPFGPVDHEVPVLRATKKDGQPLALLFGYACHCTTLGGNYYRISGDWAGFAQDFVERAFPGCTALFVTGCGADANPAPRGTLDLARQHGLELAGAVSKACRTPGIVVAGPLRALYAHVDLPLTRLPTRAELEERRKHKDVFQRRFAERMLAHLDREGKLPTSYPCPVQIWKLGDRLTFIALGGEVVVDYALRLKREYAGHTLWVAGYCNDVFAYVPSARILIEGGYEADYNLVYYGLPGRFTGETEQILVSKIRDMLGSLK